MDLHAESSKLPIADLTFVLCLIIHSAQLVLIRDKYWHLPSFVRTNALRWIRPLFHLRRFENPKKEREKQNKIYVRFRSAHQSKRELGCIRWINFNSSNSPFDVVYHLIEPDHSWFKYTHFLWSHSRSNFVPSFSNYSTTSNLLKALYKNLTKVLQIWKFLNLLTLDTF